MSQEMNMNEKPTLERKKTPLNQLNADKTTIPRDDQLGQEKWKEPTTFDNNPIIEKPARGRTIEITEVEYHFPAAGKEKLGEGVTPDIPLSSEWSADQQKPGVLEGAKDKLRQGVEKAKATFTSNKSDAEWSADQQRPGVLEGAKDKLHQGVEKVKATFTSDKSDAEWTEGQQNKPGVMEGAKDKLRHGVEKAKAVFTSDKSATTYTSDQPVTTTTTTITPDSELTENKPGVIERVKGVFSSGSSDSGYTDQSKPGVIQGAKNMVWQGVEKAKGVFSSTKITDPTELHPGNGYDWKRVVGEQGQVCWVATNDWSGDSSNRGGILEGAKGMVRSGVEKAKGVFSSKESEVTDYPHPQTLPADQKTGLLQGAKEKVWHGVEKAKSVFSSAPTEQHPGRSYTWHKTTGAQGQTHWEARNDWSNDSANQQNKSGVIQGAKDKVWQGVEKAKGMFSSTTTEPTQPTFKAEGEQPIVKGFEGQNFKTTTGYKGQTQMGTQSEAI